MTIVIKGTLTTEKVEQAIKQFEIETETRSQKKKFWPLKINTVSALYKKQPVKELV